MPIPLSSGAVTAFNSLLTSSPRVVGLPLYPAEKQDRPPVSPQIQEQDFAQYKKAFKEVSLATTCSDHHAMKRDQWVAKDRNHERSYRSDRKVNHMIGTPTSGLAL
eukprot:TRINITY_DN2372_c0_g1_i1.p2 TRINITY_DN2372_c0_g1~~TRINITY_DN2372_c0_g1_i1.p2  ORF type:complete len:106 (+),score=2.93 TRINITY_DN2372_c0_g1_i1:685-1002(+)